MVAVATMIGPRHLCRRWRRSIGRRAGRAVHGHPRSEVAISFDDVERLSSCRWSLKLVLIDGTRDPPQERTATALVKPGRVVRSGRWPQDAPAARAPAPRTPRRLAAWACNGSTPATAATKSRLARAPGKAGKPRNRLAAGVGAARRCPFLCGKSRSRTAHRKAMPGSSPGRVRRHQEPFAPPGRGWPSTSQAIDRLEQNLNARKR